MVKLFLLFWTVISLVLFSMSWVKIDLDDTQPQSTQILKRWIKNSNHEKIIINRIIN